MIVIRLCLWSILQLDSLFFKWDRNPQNRNMSMTIVNHEAQDSFIKIIFGLLTVKVEKAQSSSEEHIQVWFGFSGCSFWAYAPRLGFYLFLPCPIILILQIQISVFFTKADIWTKQNYPAPIYLKYTITIGLSYVI